MNSATSAPPRLRIAVEDVGVQEFAAVPTLRFTLSVESLGRVPIRSVMLDTQIRVAAPRRSYTGAEADRLVELFGPPHQWGTSLRSLLWSRVTLLVPAFTGSTRVDLPVGCTYDFELAVVKYFRALDGGEIPLELLFGGSVFYSAEGGLLQTARIPWDTEAEHRMPVAVWQEMIDRYFPGSGWLLLRRDTLDRLYAYKARGTLPSLDAAVDALLRGAERGTGRERTGRGTERETER